MLLSDASHDATGCSFDPSVNSFPHIKTASHTAVCNSKDRICSDFGGWVSTAPRKRRTKTRCGSGGGKSGQRNDHKRTIKQTEHYYKRYRVDPLEGTFKHYNNHEQYMKLYRESTTLCYKQRTLQELTSLYSAALDISSERRHQHPTLAEIEAAHRWEIHGVTGEMISCPLNVPCLSPDTPLMLLPSAPSIPSRLSQNQIPQTAFMCNAYMNRNIVCPVHRLIHRKNGVAMGKKFVTSGREHIKVELPGIPKRRLASHAKRLQSLRQTHPIIGFEGDTSTIGNAQNSSQQGAPDAPAVVSDRPESRINSLLSPDNPTPSPSERITKVLSGGKKRLVPSMQLPVTALLQYSPNNQHPPPETHPVRLPAKIKKPMLLVKNRQSRLEKLNAPPAIRKGHSDSTKPPRAPDVRQINYEQQYEQFFNDILENSSKRSQKKHFQNLSQP